jgi:5-methylcytosine-specific restriction endonuclease McrA
VPDVRPDPKPVSEGGIGRKKPRRGWRTRGRKMATREEWESLRAKKLYGQPCRFVDLAAFTGAKAHRAPMLQVATELHHLVPRSRGGDDVADNLVPLCADCHDAVERWEDERARLAEKLTDAEHAYIVAKLGEGGMGRLFGV